MTASPTLVKDRPPTVDELIAVCDGLGIGFGYGPAGEPVLKVRRNMRAEGELLAKLFRRNPWRTNVLKRKGLDGTKHPVPHEPARPVEVLFPGTGLESRATEPGRWPAGAYFWRHAGQTDWRPIPGRTWDAAAKRGKRTP
jgi:hypothetical protein